MRDGGRGSGGIMLLTFILEPTLVMVLHAIQPAEDVSGDEARLTEVHTQ